MTIPIGSVRLRSDRLSFQILLKQRQSSRRIHSHGTYGQPAKSHACGELCDEQCGYGYGCGWECGCGCWVRICHCGWCSWIGLRVGLWDAASLKSEKHQYVRRWW